MLRLLKVMQQFLCYHLLLLNELVVIHIDCYLVYVHCKQNRKRKKEEEEGRRKKEEGRRKKEEAHIQ